MIKKLYNRFPAKLLRQSAHSPFTRLIVITAVCLLASCGNKNQSTAPNGNNTSTGVAKPHGIITIVPQKTTLYSKFPATIQGQQNVEIRPQIDGYLQALYVDEGSVVKKGQLLFRISAPLYEQGVRTAQA